MTGSRLSQQLLILKTGRRYRVRGPAPYLSESLEGQSHGTLAEGPGQCHTTEWTNILCKLQSRETLIFKGQWLIHLGIDCIFSISHFLQYFIAQTQLKAKEFKTCKIIHPSEFQHRNKSLTCDFFSFLYFSLQSVLTCMLFLQNYALSHLIHFNWTSNIT